jgi:DNA polymerase I
VSNKNEQRNQPTLFQIDGLDREAAWRPPETLPDLDRFSELWVDTETTGTNRFQDLPVGLAVAAPDGSAYYLPFGHRGGNLDANMVRSWAKRNLANKTLIGSWLKFDTHILRNWNLPLDEMNVTLRDVQHQACLLNEQRRQSGLDLLSKEYLGQEKADLDRGVIENMARVHSSLVGPYAEQDVRLTRALDLHMRPLVAKEGLDRVLALEDSLIFPVVEMENNGLPLDLEKLERWRLLVRKEYEQGLRDLRDMAGFPCNPKSNPDLRRLFEKWGMAPPIDEEDGAITFAAPYLRPLRGKHHGIKLLLRVKGLGTMLSNFLDNYPKVVGADGKLRYNLHQLRADEYGTITGRFSAAGDEHGGINPQQVFHPDNQEKKLGNRDYLIRELFIPEKGRMWVSADAAQIQYRLFAAVSGNSEILNAYANNPDTDFHDYVTEMVRRLADPNAKRKDVKNVNFAKLFGAGMRKIRRMLECSEPDARAFVEAYNQAFPEVGELLKSVEAVIRQRHRESGVGYVRTMLGRRRRYTDLKALHTGFNAYIQGTEADIVKIKIRQAYDARKDLELTMRVVVHDELDGDTTHPDKARQLHELLNEPALPNLRVPIKWETGVGPDWAHVEDLPRLERAA